MSTLTDTIVLVVDDDPKYQDIHRRLLEDRVGRVLIAANRSDALQLIQRRFFHAAILDIRLIEYADENIEGLELAREFYERGESTGIIIVSGYGTTDRVRTAFRGYRVVDFLDKAFYTPEQLYKALKDAVSEANLFLDQTRESIVSESLFRQDLLRIALAPLDFTQRKSLDRVVQYIARPLAPLLISHDLARVDGVESGPKVLESRLWSRFNGKGYLVRIGPRRVLQAEIGRLHDEGRREDIKYTIGNISGYRCVDDSLTPEKFS